MTLELTYSNGEKARDFNIISMEISADIDAACDSARIVVSKVADDDITDVTITDDKGETVFAGVCDMVEKTKDDNGEFTFIYSRSYEALLCDCQAEPTSVYHPTSNQMCETFARRFGMTCLLPKMHLNGYFTVNRGTSCFGAINGFVNMVTGDNIIVTPSKEITLQKSNNITSLDEYSVIKTVKTTDYSKTISRINYKTDAAENYRHHIDIETQGAHRFREQYLNLISVNSDMAEVKTESIIKDNLQRARTLTLTVEGAFFGDITSQILYENEAYTLLSRVITYLPSGAKSVLTLGRNIRKGQRTYVD